MRIVTPAQTASVPVVPPLYLRLQVRPLTAKMKVTQETRRLPGVVNEYISQAVSKQMRLDVSVLRENHLHAVADEQQGILAAGDFSSRGF